MIESHSPFFPTSNVDKDDKKSPDDSVNMSMPEIGGDQSVAEQTATEPEMKPDLYSRAGIEEYLKQSTDANDFDRRYDEVSKAYSGRLPNYWFTLLNGGDDSAAGTGKGVLGYLYEKGVLKRK